MPAISQGLGAPVASVVLVLVIAFGGLAATVASGTSPQLGLDLQGGASVVLHPKTKVPASVLDQAIEIIRNRVDALGVAEPDISRQGSSIIVQLPGVRNRDRALEVVGQTAQLFFRPVVETMAPGAGAPLSEQSAPEAEVVLPERDREGRVLAHYRLGPSEVTGRALSGARAVVDPTTGGWGVEFSLTSSGTQDWNDMAAKIGQGGRVAIDLDGEVKSAPTLQTTNFPGKGQITGNFNQREAKDLALVLRYGSLPVQLEPQTVQTVSASLGRDSLRAGVISGLVGLGLVALYMVIYYRALGLVVWLGLGVTAAVMYSLVSLLGRTSGLALTLAGATGVIVSVGVTVDSYVVFFERLKDQVRAGRSVRSSVARGFSGAYRTILAADLASFMGAVVLYVLTVGSVRGFAFFLALSTLLDLVIAYFFTRPIVLLLARSRLFTEARWLGVARGLAADKGALS
ncbi:MAG TPA: protein translocase subunit SecD [Acidimicrobiales bacterium]|jgi:preprotein translocase subunit SecD|nr:protein translocase subunit SecD [Acidimicrobiales bacterium]